MFGSQVLETAAGLAFIYLVLSTFASAINEAIAGILALRARSLETSLKSLLAENATQPAAVAAAAGGVPQIPVATGVTPAQAGWNVASSLLQHPSVSNLNAPRVLGKGVSKPAYLEGKTFANVLLDIVAPDSGSSLAQVRSSVDRLQNKELRRALLPLMDQAAGDIDKARANIESWYDQAMDRLSGMYKRRAQCILFLLGFAIAASLNIDTIHTVATLWKNPVLREQLVEQAKEAVKNNNSTTPPSADSQNSVSSATTALDTQYSKMATPLGWAASPSEYYRAWGEWWRLVSLLGWLFTALAVSFGAPFWFDFLNNTLKLNARLSGAKPNGN
jgi:hypothetical protein